MADIELRLVADNTPASNAIKEFTGDLEDARKQTDGLGTNINKNFKQGADSAKVFNGAVKNVADSVNIAGVNVGRLGSSISGATNSIGGMVRGLGLLRTAFIATGIGAFVAIIGGLVAYFNRTEKGAEKLERVMSGLGAAFDVIVGLVAPLGDAIISAFENPKKALEEFGNFLLNNIINRFKSFGVIIEAIRSGSLKQLGDGFVQLGTGVTNASDKISAFTAEVQVLSEKTLAAAAAAAALTGKFQDLEDAERASKVTLSENNILIDQLIAKSKNRTLSEGERIKLLSRAGELEKANLASELKFSNQAIELINQENNLKRAAGTFRDEDDQKQVDAIVKRNGLIQASIALQERIQGRVDQLREAEAQARDADLQKEQERLDKNLKLREKQSADFLAISKVELESTQELREQQFQIEQQLLQEQFLAGLIKEEEYNKQKSEIQLRFLQEQLLDLQDYQGTAGDLSLESGEKELEINQFVLDQKLEQRKKANDEEIKSEREKEKSIQEVAQASSAFIESIGVLAGAAIKDAEFDMEAFSKKFAVSLLENVERVLFATVFKSTAEALASADSVATFGIAGIAKAALLTGLIKGAFAIVKSQIGQFHDGGFTGSGSEWDAAGIVHKEEFVSTKKTTKKYRPILEALHREDFSRLKSIDLRPILEGTGIRLIPSEAEGITKVSQDFNKENTQHQIEMTSEMKSTRKMIKRYFDYQQNKEERTVLPDGTLQIKKGNVTRRIRKK